MFLDLLPEFTHLPIAWMSLFVLIGGTAAVGWYWIRKVINYYRPDRSAIDD